MIKTPLEYIAEARQEMLESRGFSELVKLSFTDEQNLFKQNQLIKQATDKGIHIKYEFKKNKPGTLIKNNIDRLVDALYDEPTPDEVTIHTFETTQRKI